MECVIEFIWRQKRHECTNIWKVKYPNYDWQLYRTSLPDGRTNHQANGYLFRWVYCLLLFRDCNYYSWQQRRKEPRNVAADAIPSWRNATVPTPAVRTAVCCRHLCVAPMFSAACLLLGSAALRSGLCTICSFLSTATCNVGLNLFFRMVPWIAFILKFPIRCYLLRRSTFRLFYCIHCRRFECRTVQAILNNLYSRTASGFGVFFSFYCSTPLLSRSAVPILVINIIISIQICRTGYCL